MFKLLSSQRGAMFSMDTRIALVIISVLAGIVGTQIAQKIERDRAEIVDTGAEKIAAAIKDMDNNPVRLYRGGYNNYVVNPRGAPSFRDTLTGRAPRITTHDFVDDRSIDRDPWGHDWMLGLCNTNATVKGITLQIVNGVIYSGGPDRTYDSGISSDDGTVTFLDKTDPIACATDYNNWSPVGDDVGVKFSTLEKFEASLNNNLDKNIELVQKRLQEYVSSLRLENKIFCATTPNPELLHPRCDFNGDGVYQPGEEQNLNYYPRSARDTNDGATSPNNYYYIPHGRAAVAPELDELPNDSSIISVIGLHNKYISIDNTPVVICYDSNRTNVLRPPFVAKIGYGFLGCP